jgi:hypothetical protein
MKVYIENLVVMSDPTPKVELLWYIASSGAAVSAALVEERRVDGVLKQVPIYLVSEALSVS